jgi:hypothetical protein
MISLKKFRTPSARRSPGYFWGIGMPLDAKLLRERLQEMLDKNIRTVCLHPVPPNFRIDIETTMSPTYLSDEYHKIIGEVIKACDELGMNYYLYDEGGWPSGGACGQVWESNPELFTRKYIVPDGDSWKIIKEDVRPELAAPYPNLLEKGVTEKFIAITHEAHRKYSQQHFGKTMHMAFTDEPTMPGITAGARLGYCSDLFEEFHKRKGYRLEDHLHDIFTKHNHSEMRGDLADKLVDHGFGFRGDDRADDFSAAIEDQSGEHFDLFGLRKLGIFVDVHLYRQQGVLKLLVDFIKSGGDPAAVATPGGPKIYQDGRFAVDHLMKLFFVDIDSCHVCQLLSLSIVYPTGGIFSL